MWLKLLDWQTRVSIGGFGFDEFSLYGGVERWSDILFLFICWDFVWRQLYGRNAVFLRMA